jgi:hypothetical protein
VFAQGTPLACRQPVPEAQHHLVQWTCMGTWFSSVSSRLRVGIFAPATRLRNAVCCLTEGSSHARWNRVFEPVLANSFATAPGPQTSAP